MDCIPDLWDCNPGLTQSCPVLQIYCILSAIRERKKSFVFTDGSTVSLDPRVGFFITMVSGEDRTVPD